MSDERPAVALAEVALFLPVGARKRCIVVSLHSLEDKSQVEHLQLVIDTYREANEPRREK